MAIYFRLADKHIIAAYRCADEFALPARFGLPPSGVLFNGDLMAILDDLGYFDATIEEMRRNFQFYENNGESKEKAVVVTNIHGLPAVLPYDYQHEEQMLGEDGMLRSIAGRLLGVQEAGAPSTQQATPSALTHRPSSDQVPQGTGRCGDTPAPTSTPQQSNLDAFTAEWRQLMGKYLRKPSIRNHFGIEINTEDQIIDNYLQNWGAYHGAGSLTTAVFQGLAATSTAHTQ